MSLSDVVSSLNLGAWAIAALLIFLGVFVAVSFRVILRFPKSRADAAARLVLDDTSERQGGAS